MDILVSRTLPAGSHRVRPEAPSLRPGPLKAKIIRLDDHRSREGFTPFDMAALRLWEGNNRRVEICQAETGLFAMLYDGSMSWASWGVMRQGHELLVWSCVTFADLGRFAHMSDALHGIPHSATPAPAPPASNIICLRSRRPM